MHTTAACCTNIAFLVVVFSVGSWPANEPKPRNDLVIFAAFAAWPETFLDDIGQTDRKDRKHGFLVLNDIEAFFLLQQNDEQATNNWPLTRNAADFGTTIRITYQTDPPTDCSVFVRPSVADGGRSTLLSIEAPKGSTFTMNGKVDVRLPLGSVVYLPSQTLLDNGKRLYLVVWPSESE